MMADRLFTLDISSLFPNKLDGFGVNDIFESKDASNKRYVSTTTTFTHANREWIVESCVDEGNTQHFVRIRPATKGPPFPTHEEYRAARAAYFAK